MATIILTGGGTAGHCSPNMALVPYLREKFDKIYYIGSYNGIEKEIVSKTDIPYYSIDCAKLNRSLTIKNLKIPFTVLNGIKQAEKLIDELKPDIIFSKGGYVSLPTVIAGHRKKIPVISHESDYSSGLANKITARYCSKVLTTFEETAKEFNNGLFVGAPIRKELFETDKKKSVKFFGFSGDKPILLVTGGSQGSKAINNALRDTLEQLLSTFDIIHLCGKGNLYKEKTPKGYYQAEFLDDMAKAFSACDLCVSRAGANTLFELLALNKPCVLIPLPKGNSRGDQIQNAKYFQRKGLVTVITQDVLTKNSLKNAILATYANRFNLKELYKNQTNYNGTEKIVKIIFDYIKN